MRPLRAVIFDLDDTLYSEKQYTLSGYRAVANAFSDRLSPGFDLYARMVALFDTPDRGRVFNVILEEAGAFGREDLLAEMIHTFRAHRPIISLYPDAAAALGRLAGRHSLGVISDGYYTVQKAKVDALGVAARLDVCILTDRWGRQFWKPHPRAFDEAAAQLGLRHDECVYVADNPAKDFVAPNRQGWRSVCIRRPEGIYRNEPAAPGGEPQCEIESLDDIEQVLTI